jgi:hypothetical protein
MMYGVCVWGIVRNARNKKLIENIKKRRLEKNCGECDDNIKTHASKARVSHVNWIRIWFSFAFFCCSIESWLCCQICIHWYISLVSFSAVVIPRACLNSFSCRESNHSDPVSSLSLYLLSYHGFLSRHLIWQIIWYDVFWGGVPVFQRRVLSQFSGLKATAVVGVGEFTSNSGVAAALCGVLSLGYVLCNLFFLLHLGSIFFYLSSWHAQAAFESDAPLQP